MSANLPLPLLQSIRIAAPCSVRWDDMSPTADGHTRHCGQCNLNVHNFAGMTSEQAESILRSAFNADGTRSHRVCAGIYRRADGTILTADCPVGLAAVRAKARRAVARAAAALGLTTLIAWAAAHESSRYSFARTQPLTAIADYLRGSPVTPPSPTLMEYGDVCPAAPQPAPSVLNWLNSGATQ